MGEHSPHRRSGSAVIEFIHQLGWIPRHLVVAGVGVKHDDVNDFKRMWPHVIVEGFEPNPHSYEGLKSTFPGFLHPVALGCKDERANLFFNHSWKNGSSLHPPEERGPRTHQVDVHVMPLDVFLSDETLLWLDVEGHELEVLLGAQKFLKNVKAINIEMTGKPRGEGWCEPIEVHSFLTHQGFLQTYVHSIRTVRGQFDAIYVRPEIFKPEMCSCIESIYKHHEWLQHNKVPNVI